jgi:hypothetical protein
MIKQLRKLITDFFKIFYAKGIKSVLISLLFLLGLIYLLLPGPSGINDFPAVPDSTKSQLEGDTVQNPNLVAYFSDFKREYLTDYYYNYFKDWSYWGVKLPVFKINHPPERAYTFIRDQQESSALEEYYRPFRESFFVNVYDPVIYNQIRRKNIDFWNSHLEYEGRYYGSKVTVRYYHSSLVARVGVYILMFFSTYLLIRLFTASQLQKRT